MQPQPSRRRGHAQPTWPASASHTLGQSTIHNEQNEHAAQGQGLGVVLWEASAVLVGCFQVPSLLRWKGWSWEETELAWQSGPCFPFCLQALLPAARRGRCRAKGTEKHRKKGGRCI